MGDHFLQPEVTPNPSWLGWQPLGVGGEVFILSGVHLAVVPQLPANIPQRQPLSPDFAAQILSLQVGLVPWQPMALGQTDRHPHPGRPSELL